MYSWAPPIRSQIDKTHARATCRARSDCIDAADTSVASTAAAMSSTMVTVTRLPTCVSSTRDARDPAFERLGQGLQLCWPTVEPLDAIDAGLALAEDVERPR